MCFGRAFWFSLTGVVFTMALQPATAQEITVPQVLDLLEGSTSGIKSFDVTVETTTSFLLKYETAGEGPDREVTSSRKLRPDEEPTMSRMFTRQRYERGNGRIEYLNAPGGKPTTVIVHDGEVEKVLDLHKGTGLIRRPNAILLGAGCDYLESYRSLHGRLALARSLRQRSDVTARRTDNHVVVETYPNPEADINYPQWGFRVTLDPTRGFIPVIVERFEVFKGKPVIGARRTVTEVKDIGGGVWVPLKVVTQLYDDDPDRQTFGELANEITLTVDQSKSTWNKSITEAAFQLTFPAGVQTNDYLREVSYVTGKSDPGKNLKDLASRTKQRLPIVSSVYPVEEPKRAPVAWIVAGAFALTAAVAGTFFFIRKRRLEPQI